MKHRAWFAVAMLLLIGDARSAEPPVIVSAVVSRDGLTFEPPIAIPWDGLAPANLRQGALAADAARRRTLFGQKDDYGSTELPFPLPLPPNLRRRRYYVIEPDGVREIHPTGLIGTVRIHWEDDRDTIQFVQAFGEVRAPEGTVNEGGFVLISTQPLRLMTAPSSLSADALLAPHGGTYKGQGTPFRQIVRQFQVRQTAPSENRWVFVQWRPDDAMLEIGCTLRLTLFHLGPEPAQVATLDSGCDV